jgi:hypothetical protein
MTGVHDSLMTNIGNLSAPAPLSKKLGDCQKHRINAGGDHYAHGFGSWRGSKLPVRISYCQTIENRYMRGFFEPRYTG